MALSPRGIFIFLLILGFSLRMGYGILRYQHLLGHSEGAFITLWDFDAAEHVLIAHALLAGKGYIVDDVPPMPGKHVRSVGREALFKAPLYQFFLAGVFALSGFSFQLFFPLQALAGGLLSALVGLIALRVFERMPAALFAGTAAAAHPVLVNSASQPYNENVFFCLFVGSLLAYMSWLATGSTSAASLSGILIALAILTRETAIPLLVVMLIFGAYRAKTNQGLRRGLVAILVIAVTMVAPWSLRNYFSAGVIVPVASQSGTVLGLGNNPCIADEGLLVPFWGDEPCPAFDAKRTQLMAELPQPIRGSVVLQDRIDARLALEFIEAQPMDYLRLTARRAWTVLLPYHPRSQLGALQRTALAMYWLTVLPVGVIVLLVNFRQVRGLQCLLILLIGAALLPLVLIYLSPDMRYRVGADILLGCFAGWGYDRVFRGQPILAGRA
jgi:Dolichyl-phosphate-mannose-protein mannosyltransferase